MKTELTNIAQPITEEQDNTERETHSPKGTSRSTAKIHVSPEVAELVKIYCVLHQKRMVEFVSGVLARELEGFKSSVHELRIQR